MLFMPDTENETDTFISFEETVKYFIIRATPTE